MLAYAPLRWRWIAVGGLVLGAVLVTLTGAPKGWEDALFFGCWASIIATTGAMHLPKGPGRYLSAGLGLNAGVWSGAVIAVAGSPLDLAIAMPWALLFLPATVVLKTPVRLGVKIVGSWLAAVAILAAAIPMTPTPGYRDSHRD